MKKIGFLSFGHWSASQHSRVRSGADALLQSIELAVAAEEAGADGACAALADKLAGMPSGAAELIEP